MTDVGTVLEAEELLVGYAGAPVCGAVSMALRAGDVLGIVGLNGAGKSTVARTLAGRQVPLAGDVRVQGLPVDPDTVQFRRGVSAVFDDDLFFPSLSVREHLLLVARGHSMKNPDESVDAELAFFGLAARSHVVPDALSSGQRRRLLLAAGLMRPSNLLILDEPEQRLDPLMRDDLGQRLRDYARGGGTVVLVTHDPVLLTTAASTCLVIDDAVHAVTPEQGASTIAGS
ncbi:ABC transporter ATP-binding protein [Pseudarthrobacter sp. efr-133-R2A-89]|uniref:ABC transporter ATP-binding protein n=1 Tax=Pseudarthrobacter sp. efr-133-R2A-89 TaxID=3040302 RepID=UPI002552D266|nr:ABC transporter ATP-binding protein [Pseudarthrobacter sp. efr-133-R2A-89]